MSWLIKRLSEFGWITTEITLQHYHTTAQNNTTTLPHDSTEQQYHTTTHGVRHSVRRRGSHNHTPSLTASQHHHSVRHSSAQHSTTQRATHSATPRRSPDHDDRQRQIFFGGVGQILNPSTIRLTDACDGIIG